MWGGIRNFIHPLLNIRFNKEKLKEMLAKADTSKTCPDKEQRSFMDKAKDRLTASRFRFVYLKHIKIVFEHLFVSGFEFGPSVDGSKSKSAESNWKTKEFKQISQFFRASSS